MTLYTNFCVYLAMTQDYCMTLTLSPTCNALDTNMGGKKKRESNDFHRLVHMGMGAEVILSGLIPCKAQSLRTPLTTGGFVKRS